jgi:SNF2 family DNA or RNA helicase
MFYSWIRGGIPLKARYWPCHRIGQIKKVNVLIHNQKIRGGKIIRLQENKKLLSDALLDENHISPERRKFRFYFSIKNLLLQ